MNFLNAVNKYRRARWCYTHHLSFLALFIRNWIYLIHNCYIPYTAEIGENTVFAYKGIGVIIHANSKIGDNCVIGSNVTIGGGGSEVSDNKRIKEFDCLRRDVPVVGNRVHISTGAKLIGGIVIGDDVIIGANAVVRCDVPSRTVYGGVPAKLLRERSQEEIEFSR